MILEEIIKINIYSKNRNYYKCLGYDTENKNEIVINVKDLPVGSGLEINVKCDICGNTKYLAYRKYLKNINNGGYYACCIKCANEKRKNTYLEKYGVENSSQNHEIREKINNTNIERYGSICSLNNTNIKNKSIQTNIERYGYENPFQNEEIKEKSKQTMLEKYGVEYSQQSDEIREKLKQTNIKKYGVEYSFQNEEIKEKSKQTMLEKYGCENPFQNQEIREKIKQTNIEKYGFEYATQSDLIKSKIKQTNLKNCGYECNLNDPINIEKIKQTNLEKYGVEHISQNKEIFEKIQLSGKKLNYYNDNLYYRGTYEKDFLDLCFQYNIKVENVKGFKYIYENVEKIYFPDFYLPEFNLIIEIKSDYYYNKDLQKNLNKELAMINYGYNFLFIINKNYDILLNNYINEKIN